LEELMARKLHPVTKFPTRRNVSPSRLSGAVGKSEREVLVILRRKLASRLDNADVPASALAALIRQFREIDHQIRGLDAAAAQLAAGEGDDDDDDVGSAGWDPDAI
jgi:hypothetical protein